MTRTHAYFSLPTKKSHPALCAALSPRAGMLRFDVYAVPPPSRAQLLELLALVPFAALAVCVHFGLPLLFGSTVPPLTTA